MRRIVTVGMALLLVGCGGPRGGAPVAAGGGPRLADGGAYFTYRNTDAKRVNLVGDFNDWSPTADPMLDEDGDGVWTLFYPLRPGAHAYKFVVDARRWMADPANPDTEPDGFDGHNSIVRIPRTGAPQAP